MSLTGNVYDIRIFDIFHLMITLLLTCLFVTNTQYIIVLQVWCRDLLLNLS